MHNFFFINTYDVISSASVSTLLNLFTDVKCKPSFTDCFLPDLFQMSDQHTDVTLDQFMQNNSSMDIKYNGNVQRYTAFELQYKTISEKTDTPYRHVNIYIPPRDRVNYILSHWLTQKSDVEFTLKHIEALIKTYANQNHLLISGYNFDYFYNAILEQAKKYPQAFKTAENRLFLVALTKVICFESASAPLFNKTYHFHQLIRQKEALSDMVGYITRNDTTVIAKEPASLDKKLQQVERYINNLNLPVWQNWQVQLLDECLHKRYKTIYYPHIDKNLISMYRDQNVGNYTKNTSKRPYSKLISIQLNSNRPAQLSAYFDNIEETTADLNNVEVLVNIDDDHHMMEELLKREIIQRKFTIKYLRTPRPKSFCDLWKPINSLLAIRDPSCYFMLNISDEMFFTEYGWDKTLEKYVGLFPDDLFRLRASRNKLRVQYDRWECSFAQDAIPITTRKWVETGGNWNPCFGPDSFQQLVSYYLSKNGMFSNQFFSRDVPLLDINFSGDVPALGITPEKRWKHTSDHIKAMEICQSYSMQLEAKRRAMKIKAQIIGYQQQMTHISLHDDVKGKRINLIDKESGNIIESYSYSLSRIAIILTNNFRKLRFFQYFGDGFNRKNGLIYEFLKYLYIKSEFLYVFRQKLKKKFSLRNSSQIRVLQHEHTRIVELYNLSKLKHEQHVCSEMEMEFTKNIEKHG